LHSSVEVDAIHLWCGGGGVLDGLLSWVR
jgi:hypothetical protein